MVLHNAVIYAMLVFYSFVCPLTYKSYLANLIKLNCIPFCRYVLLYTYGILFSMILFSMILLNVLCISRININSIITVY